MFKPIRAKHSPTSRQHAVFSHVRQEGNAVSNKDKTQCLAEFSMKANNTTFEWQKLQRLLTLKFNQKTT